MDLSADQKILYAKYGAGLLSGELSAKPLARETGLSERTFRTVRNWARKFGPPSWRVVVIGDAHFVPGQDLERCDLYADFINYQGRRAMAHGQRFAVVVIGDWHDMHAASSYDKGTIGFEGRRLTDDIEVGNRARARMQARIDPEVWAYTQRKIVTLGNHEYRVIRLVSEVRELESAFGYGAPGEDALYRPDWDQHGWEVYPFLEMAYIEQVAFVHYLPSPGNGKAVHSSANMGRKLILTGLGSVVVGHNHLYKQDHLPTVYGNKLYGVSVGCAFEHIEDYAGVMSNHAYDRGLCLLNGLRGTEFSPHFFTFDTLREMLR